MNFITIPLVVGMITLGIYKLFELFVRKKERLSMIEKIGEKFDASMIENKFSFPTKVFSNVPFGSLKAGCLLVGIGLGLLVGFFIITFAFGDSNISTQSFNLAQIEWDRMRELEYNRERELKEVMGIVYGASVFVFGGLGLLVAFVLEMKYSEKKN